MNIGKRLSSKKHKKPLPKTVWALGFVSMFMDISSEMVHSLLPVFLVSVIGASVTTIGFIEGTGEVVTLFVKIFSGFLSDRLGKRKILIFFGYLLGTVSKPLFAISGTASFVFTGKVIDRLGKGMRGAPRDAMVADFTPKNLRGAAYGLRQSLDSLGACIGPFLALILMGIFHNDFRLVFFLAVIPGMLSLLIIIFFISDPKKDPSKSSPPPINKTEIRSLPPAFWMVTGIGFIFSLARFGEAFLLLKGGDVGLSPAKIPVILAVLSGVYALGAYPSGFLSDRIGRSAILVAGLVVLAGADLVLAVAVHPFQVIFGAALWGLHMALTQGIFSALIADHSSPSVRGTAFGVFGLVTGCATLLASVIAGLIWDFFGASFTFISGALFSFLALVLFLMFYIYKNRE